MKYKTKFFLINIIELAAICLTLISLFMPFMSKLISLTAFDMVIASFTEFDTEKLFGSIFAIIYYDGMFAAVLIGCGWGGYNCIRNLLSLCKNQKLDYDDYFDGITMHTTILAIPLFLGIGELFLYHFVLMAVFAFRIGILLDLFTYGLPLFCISLVPGFVITLIEMTKERKWTKQRIKELIEQGKIDTVAPKLAQKEYEAYMDAQISAEFDGQAQSKN